MAHVVFSFFYLCDLCVRETGRNLMCVGLTFVWCVCASEVFDLSDVFDVCVCWRAGSEVGVLPKNTHTNNV